MFIRPRTNGALSAGSPGPGLARTPNIGHIHEVVDCEDLHGLVLALIEGPTLTDRVVARTLNRMSSATGLVVPTGSQAYALRVPAILQSKASAIHFPPPQWSSSTPLRPGSAPKGYVVRFLRSNLSRGRQSPGRNKSMKMVRGPSMNLARSSRARSQKLDPLPG